MSGLNRRRKDMEFRSLNWEARRVKKKKKK
jgi:hypothetical protein